MAALALTAALFLGAYFLWRDPLARDLSRGSLRTAALTAALALALWVTLGTELLGAFGALAFWPLALWWSAPLVVLLARGWTYRGTLLPLRVTPRLGFWEWTLVAPIVGVVAAAGVAAILSPPNNWDSLGYHLPRQVYWLQQRSVAHFLTYAWRQLEMPPLAEFIGLHAMVLSGGDRAANLIQWSAFVLVLAAVSVLARDLGAGRRGQLLAAFLAASVPAAFHQASNAKNDLVVSLWTCTLAHFALRVFLGRRCDSIQAAAIGSAAGLLVLTKGTGAIFAAPILVLVLVAFARIERKRRWVSLLAITAIALAINAGHFGRNIGYFGSPLGSPKEDYTNDTFAPTALASNLVRNQVLHFGSPSPLYVARVERVTRWLHRMIGADIDDPRTTFLSAPFTITYQPEHEDFAAAPVHVLLGYGVLVAALALRRRIRSAALWAYLPLPFAAFLLFCFVLQFQAWHSRLQLPVFCLLAPALGYLGDLRGLVVAGRVAALATVVVLAPSFSGGSRPLWGPGNVFVSDRWELLFRQRPQLLSPTLQVAELVRSTGVKSLAFDPVRDDWEYPIQKRVMETSRPVPSFAAFEGYQPRRPELRPQSPDMAVVFDGSELPRMQQRTGRRYRIVRQFPPYSVYMRDDLAPRFEQDPSTLPYVGWYRSAGLGAAHGPYPEWKLPMVRWGLGPRTRLEFRSEGGPMLLDMRASSKVPGCVVKIGVNGGQLAERVFPPGFQFNEAKIEFEALKGENELIFEYSASQASSDDTRPLALLFARLTILPKNDQVPVSR